VYEPNLLQSVLKDENDSQSKEEFPGFLEVPIAKLQQKWEKENIMLLQVNDLIKYKGVVFSPKKMTPVVSKWREGKIIKIQKTQITVKRTDYVPHEPEEGEEEPEEEESEEEDLYLHTLNALLVSKTSLDETRKKLIEGLTTKEEEKKAEQKDKLEERKKILLELQQKYEESEQSSIKDAVDYKLKMIGNQVE